MVREVVMMLRRKSGVDYGRRKTNHEATQTRCLYFRFHRETRGYCFAVYLVFALCLCLYLFFFALDITFTVSFCVFFPFQLLYYNYVSVLVSFL